MKISVIIPVYNLEQYIGTMIDSLCAQTDQNFEAIFVDDGSSDRSHSLILEQVRGAQFECKVFSNENAGVSAARNFGIAQATGDYVFLIDGDDYMAADCIETIRLKGDDKEADIICWAYNEVNEDHSVHRQYFNHFRQGLDWMDGQEALDNMIQHKTLWIWSGSAAYKREFLQREGIAFTVGCVCGEDQEFTLKALGRSKKVLFINKVLSYYVQRKSSVTHSYEPRRLGCVEGLFRAYAFIDSSPSPERQMAFDGFTVGHYFNNLNSCFQTKGIEYTDEVMEDVDRHVPGVNDQVLEAMKRYSGEDEFLKLRIQKFLSSPYAYAAYMKETGNNRMKENGWYV